MVQSIDLRVYFSFTMSVLYLMRVHALNEKELVIETFLNDDHTQ